MKVCEGVLDAVRTAKNGVISLDVLESLGLCNSFTLKTTLSRLAKKGKVVRLKRGVYSAVPLRDVFVCVQNVFNGYLGFSSALYLHGLIPEQPFQVTIVTFNTSKAKSLAGFVAKAIALKGKAIGFERKGDYVLSTRAKTLFDCLYLPRLAVEKEKLLEAFSQARLTANEWREFDGYVEKFGGLKSDEMLAAKKAIRGWKAWS